MDEQADKRGGHRGGDRHSSRLLRREHGGRRGEAHKAFHPRACIVGNEHGELYWATLDEYVAECKKAVAEAGPYEWRIDGLSIEGDTALVRLGSQYAGVWYSDDLSMLRIDDAWRIVHKTFYPHPGS